MAVLSLVAVSFAHRAALQRRGTAHRVVMIQLRLNAESAAAVALARLNENTNDFDPLAEPWHTHPPLNSEDWLNRDGPGMHEVQTDYRVVDEEGKLHVLLASSEALETLGMSPLQIDGLFDWMDSDHIASAHGAESDFYLSLPTPYRAKNGPVETIEELLSIRGFSPRGFIGGDAAENGHIEPAATDGPAGARVDDAGGRRLLGWVDVLTAHGHGQINLNTAPRLVLMTLPLSDGAVAQILSYRSFDAQSLGRLEDHAFRSVDDIQQLQGLADADRDVLAARCVFQSMHFRIRAESIHQPTGLRCTLHALVRIESGQTRVLQWFLEP